MKYVGRIAVVISDTYFIRAFIGICVGDIKKGEFIWECNNSLVKIFAFFTYVLGFGYGYIQISNCYAKSLKIWFEAFAVGSILIALSEIIRLLRK